MSSPNIFTDAGLNGLMAPNRSAMSEANLLRLVKKGMSDKDIMIHFLENTTPLTKPGRFMHMVYDETLSGFLDGFRSAGFDVQLKESNCFGKIKEKVYIGKLGEFRLHFQWWDEPRKRHHYSLHLITPEQLDWQLGYPGDDAKEIRMILDSWQTWYASWEQVRPTLAKIRKRLEVGQSSIDSILKHLFAGNKLRYSLRTEKGDNYLSVQMKYRRCIEIKLRPDMDLTRLSAIAEMIASVRESMDKVGAVNLTVKNYGNDITWAESHGADERS